MKKEDKNTVSPGQDNSSARAKLSTNPELKRIGQWLETVKFRKKLIGGLDPVDVWEKLEQLNRMYEDALVAERTRYNLMVQTMMARKGSEEKDGEKTEF